MVTVPPLVGRDQEQQVLSAALDGASDGAGGLVLITGEAGIGKTSLVSATLAQARAEGALVATGTCWDGDAAPGYWPWTQSVRALRLGSSAAAWERATTEAGAGLDRLLGTGGRAVVETTAFDVIDAVTALLHVVSREQPVVVALDDLQWADRPSLALLAALVGPARLGRILLVGTYRDDEVAVPDHPSHVELGDLAARATSIHLAGLDIDGCAALLARGLRSATAPSAAEVHARTGGNPLFVQQLVQLWASGGGSSAALPGVGTVISRRLARLPAPVADALAGASLLGQGFDARLLAAVLGIDLDEVTSRLGTAHAAGLVAVDTDGRWSFVHDLVREALLASTLPADRHRRHAAAARALRLAPDMSGTVAATELAHHALLAVPEVPAAEAAELLLAAATDASARVAAEEAIGHLEHALDLIGRSDSRRAVITEQLAVEQRRAGLLDNSRATFTRLLEEADASDGAAAYGQAALGLHGLGALIHDAGEQLDALATARDRLCRDTLLAPDTRDALTARVLGALARARVHQTELDRSGLDELSAEAVQLARRSGDASAVAFALLARHDAIWGPETADTRLELAIEMAEAGVIGADPEMELQAVLLEFVARLELGHPAAFAAIEHYFELEDRLQLPRCRYVAISRRATVATLQGRFDDAERYLTEAYVLGGRLGEVDRHGVYCDQRWELARQQGDLDAIDEILAAYRGDPHLVVLEIAAALDKGDFAESERLRDRFHDLGIVWPRWARTTWWALEAELAVATGDLTRCKEIRALLEPLAKRWAVLGGGVIVRGPIAHWLATLDDMLGDHDAAVAGFEAARMSAERLGARPWVVHAGAGLARALSKRGRTGDHDDAAAALAAAADEAVALGMSRVVADLHGLSVTPAARHGRFVRDGDVWTLTFGDKTVRLPDAKGLQDVHTLLRHPGVDIAAVTLLNPDGDEVVVASRRVGSDAVLDDRARSAYRHRLSTLDDAIARALARGNDDKAQHLDAERDALLAELQAATGLGGRPRRLGDESERARKAVTARIRDSLRRVADRHPPLATHLSESIVTGTSCRYEPVEPVAWET